MQTPNYKVKLQAIQVVKEWFDRAQGPLVLSSNQVDVLLDCIEGALQEKEGEVV